jgi:hypothetical protein
MNFRVYLRVEGDGISLAEFGRNIDATLPGEIRRRVHDGSPFKRWGLEYWMSAVQSVCDNRPEDALQEQLQLFEKGINAAVCVEGIDLFAVIVAVRAETDDVPEYFFSKELLSLLSRLNAGLEVDSIFDISSVAGA